MSWRDDLNLLPTRNQPLLASLVGRRIVRLRHYAEDPLEGLLTSDAYASRGVIARQLFSMADGPAFVELEGVAAICVFDSEELMSVAVEVADEQRLAEDWRTTIDATDPAYSEPRFAGVVGRRVVGVRVLQRFVDPARLEERTSRGGKHVMSPQVLDRPREAMLALDLDDERQLIFARDLVDAPNNLAVLTEADLRAPEAPTFQELLRIR